MVIVYDIDGFCSLANSRDKGQLLADGQPLVADELIIVDSEPQSRNSLIEQYYLGLRSAMFICEDTVTEEHEVRDAMQLWREASLNEACGYTHCHITLGKSVPPAFMWITKSAIIDELKDKYPDVADIQLRLSMKPRLSARVTDKNTVTFPALARAILNQYNLVIINATLNVISEDGEINKELLPQDFEYIKRTTARCMFPYLLFCHDDLSVANLPIICAHSKDALSFALCLTQLQLIFIFAHEYAHIILKHFEKRELDSSVKMLRENEADDFALQVVLGFVEKHNAYSKLDVFTAIRWLFKYQLLEENVGSLVQGKKLESSESVFEERRSEFQRKLFENHDFRGSSLFESMGFIMLVELQGILYEFGPEFISYIIDKLKEARRTGVIEPWWEKIT
jgi:hypothetical protein